MGKLGEKLLSALLILFLLSYVGYQAYRYFFTPYKTEAVFEYTVAHEVGMQGIVLREEQLIGDRLSGIETYIFEDATWVSVGQPVVEFYADRRSDDGVRQLREVEAELSRLRSAQDPAVNNFAATSILSREMRGYLGRLTSMASAGRFSSVPEMRPALTDLINRRQIATGKEKDFSPRIAQLEEMRAKLAGGGGAQEGSSVKAPFSGYFAQSVDGYESLRLPDQVGKASFEELMELLGQKPQAIPAEAVGRMVLSPRWYFLAEMPGHSAQWLIEGREVELLFDSVSGPVPATVLRVAQERDSEAAVVLFSSNIMNAELINLREAEATARFRWHSGLRVNTAAIRFQNGERGVYILWEKEILFKKIDPIYEEQGFVLSREHTHPADTGWVQMFDLVVTEGADLYDGKIVG